MVNKGNGIASDLDGLALNSHSAFPCRPQTRAFFYDQLPQLFDQDAGLAVPSDRFGDQIRRHGDTPFQYIGRLGRYGMCGPIIVCLEAAEDDVPAGSRDGICNPKFF